MKRRRETHKLVPLWRRTHYLYGRKILLPLLLVALLGAVDAYRVNDPRVEDDVVDPPYFEPNADGFTGIRSLPTNPEETRVNEGNQFQSSQPNIFAGVLPRRTYFSSASIHLTSV